MNNLIKRDSNKNLDEKSPQNNLIKRDSNKNLGE
jgi:hypothetical protein